MVLKKLRKCYSWGPQKRETPNVLYWEQNNYEHWKTNWKHYAQFWRLPRILNESVLIADKMSAAIDTFNHKILSNKLEQYGVQEVEPIYQLFIWKIVHSGCWNKSSSEWRIIERRIPESSRLGPFLLFMWRILFHKSTQNRLACL